MSDVSESRKRISSLGKIEGREFTEAEGCMPKKKFYRQRAHCNPLCDSVIDVPQRASAIDWSLHYPALITDATAEDAPQVTIADVGCGFGGMSLACAPASKSTELRHPRSRSNSSMLVCSNKDREKLVLGMEIRSKVAEFVERKVKALRKEHTEKGDPKAYQNVSVVRSNTMKYLCNYFKKGQLEKLLFLFPDPHFKACNFRRRIINTHLLTEYAYLLRPGGILYTITDVQDVGDWMRDKLDAHPLFERLTDEELQGDPAAEVLATATEEGQKVRRNGGTTWRWCYRRRPAPVLPTAEAGAGEQAGGGEGNAG